jgi:hypothetical protein
MLNCIIEHLKLTFVAEKPPSCVIEQVTLFEIILFS